MYDIVIRYDNGHKETVKSGVHDLGDACADVLQLADELSDTAGESLNSPKWVEIHCGDRLEISVSVVRGGLVRSKVD